MSGNVICVFVLYFLLFVPGYSQKSGNKGLSGPIPVARVPASFPVNFALFTAGTTQFVSFYDSAHQMTIACRELNEPVWDFEQLNSKVGWDSHNYLAMVVDEKGIFTVDRVRSSFPGMVVNKVYDTGRALDGNQYLLRWETLAPNRDQQRQNDLPPDTMLELVVY